MLAMTGPNMTSASRAALFSGIVILSVASDAAAQARNMAETATDAQKGALYAEKHCASCHDVTSSSAEPKPAASFEKIANADGMTELALTVWFRTPHPNMPNLVLQPEDQRNVIAYIMSLQRRK